MEALNIAIETFAYFRWLFATADLMPSIHVGAVCEKLDRLREEVVYPAFANSGGKGADFPRNPHAPDFAYIDAIHGRRGNGKGEAKETAQTKDLGRLLDRREDTREPGAEPSPLVPSPLGTRE